MAAQPIKRQLLADIKPAGGWNKIFERVASGETQTAIAESFGVSQGFFSRILNHDEERRSLFREAKRQAAPVYADQALMIVDAAPAERDAVQKARAQADVRKWLAGSYDRETFGQQQASSPVVVNVQMLHLQALKAVAAKDALQAPTLRVLPPGKDASPPSGLSEEPDDGLLPAPA